MEHWECRENFQTVRKNRISTYYRNLRAEKKFEKGKKVAEKIKREQERKQEVVEKVEYQEAAQKEQKDVISKLVKLGELKEKGILSDEEFAAMKKKLINEF